MTDEELVESLAQCVWVIESGDQMIPASEAQRIWSRHREERSQKYLSFIWNAQSHISALRGMGLLVEAEKL